MYWWALLLVMLAYPAWAADGDVVSNYCSGAWCVEEILLCDGDHSATDCEEFDLHTEGNAGLPWHIQFDLSRTTGCAGAVTVQVRGLATPLGNPSIIGTLSVAGTSSVPLATGTFRSVDGVVGTAAGCTDLEVLMRMWYPAMTPGRHRLDPPWLFY